MNVLQTIAGGITGLIAPDLQSVEAQAQAATQQLQLAFEVIIAEGGDHRGADVAAGLFDFQERVR